MKCPYDEPLIRLAEPGDLPELLRLYTFLHNNPFPEVNGRVEEIWARITSDPNHYILLGIADGQPVSSCVLVVIENLTHGQKPYAVIENVITHPDYRGRGYASAVLSAAKDIAVGRGCYKIMLMTGAKDKGTLNFYKRAGFNADDKTAFVMWV